MKYYIGIIFLLLVSCQQDTTKSFCIGNRFVDIHHTYNGSDKKWHKSYCTFNMENEDGGTFMYETEYPLGIFTGQDVTTVSSTYSFYVDGTWKVVSKDSMQMHFNISTLRDNIPNSPAITSNEIAVRDSLRQILLTRFEKYNRIYLNKNIDYEVDEYGTLTLCTVTERKPVTVTYKLFGFIKE